MTAAALVTGSSRGLGRAVATLLARRGYEVFAGARRPEDNEDLLRQADHQGWNVVSLALDVNDPDSVARAVAQAEAPTGRVDVLVNNAAVVVFDAVETTSAASIGAMLDTNLAGPLRMIQAALPAMRATGGGTIVNVTSLNALVPMPWLGVYSATKHALSALSAALAIEVEPFGIRVLEVRPGLFRSAIGDQAAPPELAPPYADDVQALIEARRAAVEGAIEATEVAEVVVAAIEDAAADPILCVGADAEALSVRWNGLDVRERSRLLRRFR